MPFDQVQAGNVKYISETETVIMEIFLVKYLEIRLTNLFLIDVCQPLLDYIDFFESLRVRCHLRHPKMAILLSDHMGRFVKENVALLTPTQLLRVDLGEGKLLSRKEVMLGTGVDRLLLEMGMTPESPEIKPFMDSVFRFYKKSTESMIKYFSTPLKSKLLR